MLRGVVAVERILPAARTLNRGPEFGTALPRQERRSGLPCLLVIAFSVPYHCSRHPTLDSIRASGDSKVIIGVLVVRPYLPRFKIFKLSIAYLRKCVCAYVGMTGYVRLYNDATNILHSKAVWDSKCSIPRRIQ